MENFDSFVDYCKVRSLWKPEKLSMLKPFTLWSTCFSIDISEFHKSCRSTRS